MNQLNSFYSSEELNLLGFSSIGKNVLISRKVSIYQADKISIGNNVRIDDYCILSGNITIRNYVHISAFCALFGARDGIFIDNYSGLSARTTIYAASDDFNGDFFANAIIDNQLRNVIHGAVIIKQYVSVCTNCIILPNVTLDEGCVVGALSLVNKSLSSWKIYAGTPIRYIKERNRNMINLEPHLG